MEIAELDLTKLKTMAKEFAETLPVAHYLKVSSIQVVMDEDAETSYFDAHHFNIHVAFNNVLAVMKDRKIEELNEVELENVVRCFLYHEVSHAILTPRNLMIAAVRYSEHGKLLNSNFANIIEDERIETLLKDYYYGVDFRKNLHSIVKLEHAKTFEQFVFNAVRFRYCPTDKELVNKAVNNLIKATSTIDAYINPDYMSLCERMETLLAILKDIWDKLPKAKSKECGDSASEESEDMESTEGGETATKESTEGDDKSSKQSKSKGEETADTEGEEDCEEQDDTKGETKDAEKGKSAAEDSSSKDEVEEETSPEETEYEDDFIESDEIITIAAELIDKLVEDAMFGAKLKADAYGGREMTLADFTCEKETKCKLLKVIGKNVGFGNAQNNVMYGYSGKFNTKRFATDFNDSCKWFAKKSYDDTGINARKSEKRILNIWLDQSGSFRYNDAEINKVLKALYEIESERKDFEWRLIKLTCDANVVKNKEKRFSKSFSGNALPLNKIRQVYNEVNNSQREFNIVLFDGCANSLDFGVGCEERVKHETYDYTALAPFNNSRTIFITERSNTYSIRTVCSNAREIIEENCNYPTRLSENITKAIDLLF